MALIPKMQIESGKRWCQHLCLVMAYGIVACVMSYPVIFRLDHLPTDVTDPNRHLNRDPFIDLWQFWWVKHSIFELHVQPFFSDYIFFPQGTSLVFLPFTGIYNLVSLPFQWVLPAESGVITAYSVIVLCSFVLAAYAASLLAFEIVRDLSAAFVAGLIYSYCANRLWNVTALNLFCFEFVAFFIFFLVRLVRSPTVWRGVWTGVFFALLFYSSLSYALFASMFALALTLAYGVARRGDNGYLKELVKDGCVALASFSLVALPFLIAILSFFSEGKGETATMEFKAVIAFSNDILSFVIPSFKQKFYDLLIDFRYLYSRGIDWRVIGLKSFLGYTALALAAVGVVRGKGRQKWFWLFSMLLFLVLSLGPYLHFGGTVYKTIPLPYLVMYNWLPFFKILRAPERMIVIVMLSLAVLSAYGVKELMECRFLRRGLVVALLSFLVLLENAGVPFVTGRFPVLDIYRQMAAETSDYAILDIPIEEDMLLVSTYFQIVHEKPILEGQFSRHSPGSKAFLRGDDFLRAVSGRKYEEYYRELLADPEAPSKMRTTRRRLVENRTKYIFLHSWHMSPRDEMLARNMIRLVEPIEAPQRIPFMDGEIVVYKLY